MMKFLNPFSAIFLGMIVGFSVSKVATEQLNKLVLNFCPMDRIITVHYSITEQHRYCKK